MTTDTTETIDMETFVRQVLGHQLNQFDMLKYVQVTQLMREWDSRRELDPADSRFYSDLLTLAKHNSSLDTFAPGRYWLSDVVTFLEDYSVRRPDLNTDAPQKTIGVPLGADNIKLATPVSVVPATPVDSIDSIVLSEDLPVETEGSIVPEPTPTRPSRPSSGTTTYEPKMPIKPFLSDETLLREFSLDEYVSALGENGEVSSKDLKLLMVVSDLQNGLGVCEKLFYDNRVGSARHFRLKDEFVGRLDGRSLLFNPTEVKRFFADYDSVRANMRQSVDSDTTEHNLGALLKTLSGVRNRRKSPGVTAKQTSLPSPPKKNRLDQIREAAKRHDLASKTTEDPDISYSLSDRSLDTLELFNLKSFGHPGRKACLALESDRNTYLDCNLFKMDGSSEEVRLYYSPNLLQHVGGVTQILTQSLGEDAKDFMLYHAKDLVEVGALLPVWALTRTVSGKGVVDYINRTMDPESGVQFVQDTLEKLVDVIRTTTIEKKATPLSIKTPRRFDPHIYPSDINASPEDTVLNLKSTNDLIRERGIRGVFGSYMRNSGRSNLDSSMNLRKALKGTSVKELADQLVKRQNVRDGVRVKKKEMGMVHLGTALNTLYDLVDAHFNFDTEKAYAAVQELYSDAGIMIGDERIKPILFKSAPVYIPKKEILDTEEEDVYNVSLHGDTKKSMMFSIDSIIGVVDGRLGDISSGEIKGDRAATLFRDVCSYYTSNNVPQSVIETGLGAIAENSSDYTDELLSVPAVRLVAELAVLKYGWVDNESRVPSIKRVKDEYRNLTDEELVMKGFVIQEAEDTSLLVKTRSLEGNLVHASAVSRLNPVLSESLRGLAELGEIQTYQVRVGNNSPSLCYHASDIIEVAGRENELDLGRLSVIARYTNQRASVTLEPNVSQNPAN